MHVLCQLIETILLPSLQISHFQIPAMFFNIQGSQNDWSYRTEPSTIGSLGFRNTESNWPRGKMLGGSSGINANLYVRGNRRDYDHWAALGNAGWDYNSVLPYFIKSEDNGADANVMTAAYHGRGGPLKVNHFEDVVSPLRQIFRHGIAEMGHPWHDDIHGCGGALGFTRLQGTIQNGARCSAAKAFLTPAKDRANLHILKHAHVTRLHYADDNTNSNRVDGVEFRRDNEPRTLKAIARKEVILSAGSLNTPQILMVSGIGPADHLQSLDIPVRQNLPGVGANLLDHLWFPYVLSFQGSTAPPYTSQEMINEYYTYATNRTGPLGTLGLTDFNGFINTLNDSEYPDIQLHVFYIRRGSAQWPNLLAVLGYNDEILDSLGPANADGELVMLMPTLLLPRSVGSVKLRSKDPFTAPRMTHNYFAEQADVETAVRSIRWVQRFEKTAAFRENEVRVHRPKLRACDGQFEADSDAYWECYVRHMATTLYHPVGTTRMGRSGDAGAVVDATLRVHGVRGLRVVDAGIMPQIVSGNTNAPTIMIGERAADFVKQTHSVLKSEL